MLADLLKRVSELEKALMKYYGKTDLSDTDKIRADVDRQEKWLSQAGYSAYNVGVAFGAIKHVIAGKEGHADKKSVKKDPHTNPAYEAAKARYEMLHSYATLKHQLAEAWNRIDELDKLNGDMREKADKAIEEVEGINLNDYGDNLYQFRSKVVEILKRNIGE